MTLDHKKTCSDWMHEALKYRFENAELRSDLIEKELLLEQAQEKLDKLEQMIKKYLTSEKE